MREFPFGALGSKGEWLDQKLWRELLQVLRRIGGVLRSWFAWEIRGRSWDTPQGDDV